MKKEQQLSNFIREAQYADLTPETVKTVKQQLVALYGATIAGNESDGCKAIADFTRETGGKPEATILIHGGKVPAHQAAFVNSVMGRALDICDHIAPGVHIGSALIPAALSAAELAGGCSGKDFVTAVAVGAEVSLRLNLAEDEYAGFDPTGVCAVFASAAASARLLSLNESQILYALGLVFNECGGSFQSNIDGSLSVRVNEGNAARAGLECARLAGLGITGPTNFLDGVYGYYHLFGRDKADTSQVTTQLGSLWHLTDLNFKKYPSCGLTQGSTELLLKMIAEHKFVADDVDRLEILVPPFTYKLVGQFALGENPKVNAQFSVAYCVANALLRAPVKLSQFEAAEIRETRLLNYMERIKVISDPTIEARHHYSSDIRIWLRDGRTLEGKIDVPPGTPGNPMTEEEHRQRFFDCVDFAGKEWIAARADKILAYLGTIEDARDVREGVALFLA
ncbi:MAG: MmgE/PrpD family protein [Clostridiales Family XIII bacterium]|jgi:2-methylcitrate dehydratase PrpD|nr:MmgE/PrpD family protein [Clostridiales Family XIII bacterium]